MLPPVRNVPEIEEVVTSQAASSSSLSRPKRKRKKNATSPSGSRCSQFTSPLVPTELVPIDQAAWPPQPAEHTETPTRLLFPLTSFAIETQEKITIKQVEDRVVTIAFDIGGSTMFVLNGRYSPEELHHASRLRLACGQAHHGHSVPPPRC